MAKKVSMQQIADYLGVSKFVVSKSLAGKQGVSSETRQRVFDAASQLGYFTQKNSKVNQIKLIDVEPTKISDGEKSIVLVLMPNVRFQTKESSYWGGIVDGISTGLDKLGYGMFVVTENNVENISKVINPDGFVGVISVGLVTTSVLLEIHRMKMPLVMIDYEDPLIPCDTIFNNNFDCSLSLTNHLIGLGHQKMQFIGDIKYSRSFYDRFLGFRSSLEGNELWLDLDRKLYTINIEKFDDELKEWLNEYPSEDLPTAFVCANDNIAQRVIDILQNTGKNVPIDYSVTGFDNKESSYQHSPTLTTVNVAKNDLGKRAVEMLMRRIREQDAPFEKVMISGTIMLRESTAKRCLE